MSNNLTSKSNNIVQTTATNVREAIQESRPTAIPRPRFRWSVESTLTRKIRRPHSLQFLEISHLLHNLLLRDRLRVPWNNLMTHWPIRIIMAWCPTREMIYNCFSYYRDNRVVANRLWSIDPWDPWWNPLWNRAHAAAFHKINWCHLQKQGPEQLRSIGTRWWSSSTFSAFCSTFRWNLQNAASPAPW